MHFFSSFDPSALGHHPTYEGHSEGYVHESLVAREEGSVHTGLSVNELAPGGRIDPHVHSFEESFYVLSGEALVTINGSVITSRKAITRWSKSGRRMPGDPLERSRRAGSDGRAAAQADRRRARHVLSEGSIVSFDRGPFESAGSEGESARSFRRGPDSARRPAAAAR